MLINCLLTCSRYKLLLHLTLATIINQFYTLYIVVEQMTSFVDCFPLYVNIFMNQKSQMSLWNRSERERLEI
jgi:hypothetical protein